MFHRSEGGFTIPRKDLGDLHARTLYDQLVGVQMNAIKGQSQVALHLQRGNDRHDLTLNLNSSKE